MTARHTRIEIVARAMARADGHDPEMRIVGNGQPMMVNGMPCFPARAAGGGFELWRRYAAYAEVAVDALEQIPHEVAA